MTAKYNFTDSTVELSGKICLTNLEALDNFLLDEVTVGTIEEGQDSWMSLEEFRSEEPNVKTFNVEFTYGNGFFSVPVVDGKFDKISFDPDLEDEAEDMEELKSLLAELGIKEPEIEI